MDFPSFKKYFLFSGRASRSEYWRVKLGMCGLSIILLFIHPTGRFDPGTLGKHVGAASVPFGSLSWLKSLPEFYPVGGKLLLFNILLVAFGLSYLMVDVAVSMRRLHDLDWSVGPLLLFGLLFVPLGAFLLAEVSDKVMGVWLGLVLFAWFIFAIWVGATPGTKGENRFG